MTAAFGPLLFVLTLAGLLTIGLQHGGPEVAVGVLVVALLAVAAGLAVVDAGRRQQWRRVRLGWAT